MTIPYIIQDYSGPSPLDIEVPYEILFYCDETVTHTDREDLRYQDCVYMHMGMYGNDRNQLKKLRERLYNRTAPVFD